MLISDIDGNLQEQQQQQQQQGLTRMVDLTTRLVIAPPQTNMDPEE